MIVAADVIFLSKWEFFIHQLNSTCELLSSSSRFSWNVTGSTGYQNKGFSGWVSVCHCLITLFTRGVCA